MNASTAYLPIIALLANRWESYPGAGKAPVGLLAELTRRYDPALIKDAIDDVGRVGRLADYESIFDRFVRLRAQAQRLRTGAA